MDVGIWVSSEAGLEFTQMQEPTHEAESVEDIFPKSDTVRIM